MFSPEFAIFRRYHRLQEGRQFRLSQRTMSTAWGVRLAGTFRSELAQGAP